MSKMSQLSAEIEEIKLTMEALSDKELPVGKAVQLYASFVNQALDIIPVLLSMIEGRVPETKESRELLDGQWKAPADIHNEDFSAHVGTLGMYSYQRPSWIIWNVVMNGLMQKGFSKGAAEQWLKSKAPRWALDGRFGNMLEEVAYKFGQEMAESYASKEECEQWDIYAKRVEKESFKRLNKTDLLPYNPPSPKKAKEGVEVISKK